MNGIFSELFKLCAYLNGFAVAPILIAAVAHVSPKRRKVIAIREMIAALVMMLFFIFAGKAFLEAFGLSINAIRIGGGLVLLYSAFQLMFNDTSFSEKEKSKSVDAPKSEPFIVPIAIPMIFGPAVMSGILSISLLEINFFETMVIICGSWAITATICVLAVMFSDMFHKVVFAVASKIGGLVIAFLASQMFIDAFIAVKSL